MQTKVITCYNISTCESSLSEAAGALRAGALVVFPTETVYGLAASAEQPRALERLRGIKQAADSRPFTVHIGRRSDAQRYVSSPSPLLRRLARKGWPGPLTLVAEEPKPEQTEVGRACPPRAAGRDLPSRHRGPALSGSRGGGAAVERSRRAGGRQQCESRRQPAACGFAECPGTPGRGG